MIGWLAAPTTQGPLTRALAVLHDTEGQVLSMQRGVWATLDAYSIPHSTVPCCDELRPPARWVAELPSEVLVADRSWWDLAVADGRPLLRVGFAPDEPDWDLDAGPIHPWAWQNLPTRAAVRDGWGVPPGTPVVACMSNWQYKRVIEHRVADAVPANARLVSLRGPNAAHQFVGADLVVTTAGWASSWEARWSGVPHCLLDVGGPDGLSRVTHDIAEAREAVANVRLAELPGDHRPPPPTGPLDDFLQALARLRSG
jgi:hypothetical protein